MLTIVLPNYNDSQYIGQAIESILNQKYSAIELLIVDDGSQDNSLEIISKYQSDKRLKLITRKQNKGVVYSLNEGLAHVSYPYVLFASANDYLLPDMISKSIDLLIKYPEIGISLTEALEMNMTSGKFVSHSAFIRLKEPIKIHQQELPSFIQKSFLRVNCSGAIMKTEWVRKEGGLKEDFYCSSDWYLATKIAFSTGLIFIPEPLVCWRNFPTCYHKKILYNKQTASLMYSNLLNDLSRCDTELQKKFKQSGELGCILKFAPFELLKRPHYWSAILPAIKRFLKKKLVTRLMRAQQAISPLIQKN